MIVVIAGVIGALGLVCLMTRKTLLGILIGVQLLVLGATIIFVMAGLSSGSKERGFIFGLFIILGGVAQIVIGYVLTIRLFFQNKTTSMDELRALKQ